MLLRIFSTESRSRFFFNGTETNLKAKLQSADFQLGCCLQQIKFGKMMLRILKNLFKAVIQGFLRGAPQTLHKYSWFLTPWFSTFWNQELQSGILPFIHERATFLQ